VGLDRNGQRSPRWGFWEGAIGLSGWKKLRTSPPRPDKVAPAHVAYAAPADEHPARVMGQSDILLEAVEEACGHGLSGFDLHRDAPGPHVEDGVHLQSTGIASEIEGRPLTVVEKEVLDFVDGEIFKNRFPQGVHTQILGPAYAQEVTQDSGVQEVEFGALDSELDSRSLCGTILRLEALR
jgi:hypothetical protein